VATEDTRDLTLDGYAEEPVFAAEGPQVLRSVDAGRGLAGAADLWNEWRWAPC
jgi:hypothetical protein